MAAEQCVAVADGHAVELSRRLAQIEVDQGRVHAVHAAIRGIQRLVDQLAGCDEDRPDGLPLFKTDVELQFIGQAPGQTGELLLQGNPLAEDPVAGDGAVVIDGSISSL